MPRALVRKFAWGGLNTKAESTGLPMLDCVALQDMRLVGTDLVQRYGMVRVGRLGTDFTALEYNGTDAYCESAIDARVWTLGTKWTLEVVVEPDVTADQGILCAGTTTASCILDISSDNYRFRIWDSGATLTTLTVGAAAASVQSIQITRDGATLSGRINNGTAATATMSATLSTRAPVGNLRVGRDDAANYFDGVIDNLRLYGYVKSSHGDRLVRHPCPRAEYVMADYAAMGTDSDLFDRSRFENHLDAKGATANADALVHSPVPIRALRMGVDADGSRQLLAVGGGKFYIAEVD